LQLAGICHKLQQNGQQSTVSDPDGPELLFPRRCFHAHTAGPIERFLSENHAWLAMEEKV
jgi:hypothetical protein